MKVVAMPQAPKRTMVKRPVPLSAGLALRALSFPRLWLLLLTLAVAMPGWAAPLPAAQQAELDRAVIDYESGRRVEARLAFQALSRQGVPAAHYNLAVMHLRGELPQASRQRASQLLTRAAQGGFVTAQLMLARTFETGELGVRDLKRAHQWYGLAADSGSAEAQLAMGTGHYLGRGLAKDPVRAAHFFREAAKAGDVGAMYLLASMYEQGDGVERDLRLARYWYGIAAQNGDEAAPGKVKELDARLADPPATTRL